jgi:hypothetical protein
VITRQGIAAGYLAGIALERQQLLITRAFQLPAFELGAIAPGNQLAFRHRIR